jgi:hypothetical protein
MRNKKAKELRECAGFAISHDPQVKASAGYLAKKSAYKNLKKMYKAK